LNLIFLPKEFAIGVILLSFFSATLTVKGFEVPARVTPLSALIADSAS